MGHERWKNFCLWLDFHCVMFGEPFVHIRVNECVANHVHVVLFTGPDPIGSEFTSTWYIPIVGHLCERGIYSASVVNYHQMIMQNRRRAHICGYAMCACIGAHVIEHTLNNNIHMGNVERHCKRISVIWMPRQVSWDRSCVTSTGAIFVFWKVSTCILHTYMEQPNNGKRQNVVLLQWWLLTANIIVRSQIQCSFPFINSCSCYVCLNSLRNIM